MLRGSRGSPLVCVARAASVIGRPRTGMRTSGSSSCNGCSSSTFPATTWSASSSAVNTLVTDPISNTVRSSTAPPRWASRTPRARYAVVPARVAAAATATYRFARGATTRSSTSAGSPYTRLSMHAELM